MLVLDFILPFMTISHQLYKDIKMDVEGDGPLDVSASSTPAVCQQYGYNVDGGEVEGALRTLSCHCSPGRRWKKCLTNNSS